MLADWKTLAGILAGRVLFDGSFLKSEAKHRRSKVFSANSSKSRKLQNNDAIETLYANTHGKASQGNRDVSVGARKRSWPGTLQDI